ncbi:MAG: hypothetical protein M1813_005112 [Trichoglossum hirsutum]|nr:MAG: hypothetical protein M1813_005112 [Trichoglossum hirsutum]
MAHHPRPQAASVEDYNSDLNETLPNTRRVASSKQTRRTSGLSQMITREQDGFSDSGYSSHAPTAASSESTHGMPSTDSPPLPSANPTNLKRRPTLSSRDRSKHRSPSKGPPRASSPVPRPRSRTANKPAPHEDCDCKICTGRHPPVPTPLDTQWDTNYHPFTNGHGHGHGHGNSNNNSEPQYGMASSPTMSRSFHVPGSFPQDRPAELPVRPGLQRASTSHSMRSSRPVSYHGGQSGVPYNVGKQPGYFPPQNPYQGPPPTLANYPQSMFQSPPQFPPPSPAPPPQLNSPFPPPPPTPYSTTRNESYWPEGQQQQQYSVRGPTRPVVDYPYQHQQQPGPPPTSRRASLGLNHDAIPPPASGPPRPTLRYSSSPGSANGYDISRTASVPPQSEAAATVNTARRTMTPQPPQHQQQPRNKRSSMSAPRKQSSLHSNSTRVSVESGGSSSSDRRRQSIYDYERAQEQEHERELEREREQAYQGAIATRTPLTMEALQAIRGHQRALGNDSGSHSRESRSSREGSEDRTGAAVAFRVPDSEADNFTMRYPSGTPVKLEFTGRALAAGRTILLRPGEQGDPCQLTIGTRRYVEHREYAQIEYAQTARREIEDGRRHRETRPSNHSRRSSRSAYHRD